MQEWRCEPCNKKFTSKEGLEQHTIAKHEQPKPERKKLVWKRRYTMSLIALVILSLSIWGILAIASKNTAPPFTAELGEKVNSLPTGQVHWHPHLTISIDGKNVPIPPNIGLSIGRVVDTQLGMDRGMAPSHTHEGDGIIHIETLNARALPEVFTLGYFFYVWDKRFDKDCIFSYCTDTGLLRMTVNGVENNEYENYIMHDKDEIAITYTTNP